MTKRVFDPQTREVIEIDENAEPGWKDKYWHWSGVPFEKTPEVARAQEAQAVQAVQDLSDEDLAKLAKHEVPVELGLEHMTLEQIQEVYDKEVGPRPSNKKNDKAWLTKWILLKREELAQAQ